MDYETYVAYMSFTKIKNQLRRTKIYVIYCRNRKNKRRYSLCGA